MSNPVKQIFPLIYKHAGVWEGNYHHVNIDGDLIDTHKSRVECVFPEEGEVVYIQCNKFDWANGKSYEVEFSGIIKDEKIYWDTETFSGYGWESGNCVLLHLDRKDDPGASFTEIIVMGEDGRHRARTWHWFKDGICFKRTLCNETKIS